MATSVIGIVSFAELSSFVSLIRDGIETQRGGNIGGNDTGSITTRKDRSKDLNRLAKCLEGGGTYIFRLN